MAWVFLVETGAGIPNATSYITIAFATDYNARHPYGSDWATFATTDTIKENFCMLASRLLDQWCKWFGVRAKTQLDQGLEWPRFNVKDRNGYVLNSDTIYPWLQIATAELARKLTTEDLTLDKETGLSSLGLDVIDLVFNEMDRKGTIPESVKAMVQDYCTIAGASNFVRLRRG